MSTIPASAIVRITPGVLDAGGAAAELLGLILTNSTRIPIGTVLEFANANDVGEYFGFSSAQYDNAVIYFNGFEDCTKLPSKLLMSQYNGVAVSGYLRGGDVSAMTLAELQAITPGTLTINFGGTALTSASIDLSAATSFSNAATIIQTAFTMPDFAVSYDSVSGAFAFVSTATGAAATIVFPSNTIATPLKLTAATGAILSQGADAATPVAYMAALALNTQNWAVFTTDFDPDNSGFANKLAFSQWTNGTGDRFGYACWDVDTGPQAVAPDTGCLGYAIAQATYSGTCLIQSPDASKAVFVLAYAASLNTEETEGRATLAFRRQSGLAADVTSQTAMNNLIANGYNFYGAYGTANDEFIFMYPGSVSGDFQWMDSYVNQISLNNALQLALMTLLVNAKSIPYNQAGYTLIDQSCMDPINSALNFGSIRAGIPLSSQQAALINSSAGVKVSDTLSTRGWYLQIKDATPQVRQARGTPPCKFWYMDGQSVQKIDLASILVQ